MSHWPHATAQLSRDRSDGVDSLFSMPSTTKWKAFDREAALSSDDSDLRGLFNPALFSSSSRLKGRQRQIADLSIDELYRLAFTCSLFPGERSLIKSNNSQQSPATALTNCSSATDSDKLPHNQILHFLLTIEKTFQSESETIAREQFAPNSRAMIKMNQILLNLNYDDDNTDESENSNHDVQVGTELVLLEDVLDQWKNGHIAKSMNAIALALSMLTAMQMAFLKTLKITTNRPTWWWVKLDIAAVACSAFALAGASMLLSYAVITVAAGSTTLAASSASTSLDLYATRRWMNQLQEEYIKILRIWAVSLGIHMEQVRIHQFFLEAEISKIFNSNFGNKTDETIMQNWSKCIVAYYELRMLLSKDIAVGIIGTGKTGKSKLIQTTFGFDTCPSSNIRTLDFHRYRVSDQFSVIDFPHLTSAINSIRAFFGCNHTLVNGIIVILDALQQGDDNKTERYVIDKIKKIKKQGVEILFCFNHADKLVTQNMLTRELENEGVSEFEEYRRNQSTIRSTTKGYSVVLDSEKSFTDIEDCKLTFFDLESSDNEERKRLFHELTAIGVKSYPDIKNDWLM
ncbi:unnamed protein product [Rotaria magnacalcarata]|uniref:Uncharacterized protein n=1 Tax=Rotaria magnacalcarata TaxID=392030 RepID=A0A819URK9_9BILA|nr:unnamed protein product [Rotaria magnacalcarata]